MKLNQDIEQYLVQYFDGTINNVDKDLIDILVMTDSAVAAKFHALKSAKYSKGIQKGGYKWKIPTFIGLSSATIALLIFFNTNNTPEPITNSITPTVVRIEDKPSDKALIEDVNKEINANTDEVKEVVNTPAVTEVVLTQEIENNTPQVIFAPRAVAEPLPEVKIEMAEKEVNQIQSNNKKSAPAKKLPKLRKGKRSTVVPIEIEGL